MSLSRRRFLSRIGAAIAGLYTLPFLRGKPEGKTFEPVTDDYLAPDLLIVDPSHYTAGFEQFCTREEFVWDGTIKVDDLVHAKVLFERSLRAAWRGA